MSGYVGSRARKRNRNIFVSLGIFLLIVVIFLSFPTFENNNSEIIPNDNIIPNPSEELTSLASNIEELELNLFQKDQKIKFRDGQIENLQNDLNLFVNKKGFNVINKVKYHITYEDDSLYTKEYLLLLVREMKGLL